MSQRSGQGRAAAARCLVLALAALLTACAELRGPPPEARAWQAQQLETGLPRSGRWRGGLAVADLDADGISELIFPPPRKTLRPPRVFERAGGAWRERPISWPEVRYDYGGIAVGDFDGDGRSDLVLAAHLTGFLGLLQRDGGPIEAEGRGLPTLADPTFTGSGTGVARVPGTPDRALLLLEPRPRYGQGERRSAPGLASYRLGSDGWRVETVLDGAASGRALAFRPADRCPARIAYVPARTSTSPLLTQRRDGSWERVALATVLGAGDGRQWTVDAVAFGPWDSDRCADLAVALTRFGAGGREHAVGIVRLTRRGVGEVTWIDATAGVDVRALALGSAQDGGGPVLAALTGDGRVLLVGRAGPDTGRLAAEVPAPAWRAGCAGTDLRFVRGPAGALELYATFSGEATLRAPGQCRSGGGVDGWRVAGR